MKSTSILIFAAFIVIFSSYAVTPVHNIESSLDFITECCKPINFDQPRNIHYFLQNVFNNKQYTQEYLPFNLEKHPLQFLENGKKLPKSASYMESSIRLFYNRMKACPFSCPVSVSLYLDKAPLCIKHGTSSFMQTDFYSDIEKNMMDIFIPTFVSDFSFFKSNPEQFFKNMAHSVTVMVKDTFNLHDHIAQEQLKQMFIRFVELCFMKLVWTPNDQMGVWQSFKRLSEQCINLLELELITPDEFDDLCKSLIESFIRFLDLAGSELSMSVIETIREDIESQEMIIFEFDEQEQMIESKKDRMLDAVLQTEAKIEARKRGIITDIVVC